MTLEEIKTAVRAGGRVYWASSAYLVELHTFKDGSEQWLICCKLNDHCIGLTHRDGVTMNGTPDQFFIGA